MATLDHAEMHRDHLLWLGENDLWRDNIRVWQVELQQIIDGAPEVKELLEKHHQRLQVHAAAVRAHEQAPRQHEHQIAESEKGEANPELISLATAHQSEALERQEQRGAHQDLSRDHYAVLSHWNALLRALRESAKHNPAKYTTDSCKQRITPTRTRIEF